jgi:hypothetical protein
MKCITAALVLSLMMSAICAFAQAPAGDPITGIWSGDFGTNANDRSELTVEMKLTGKTISGQFSAEGRLFPIKKGTYNAKTGAVHMETDVTNRGKTVHYVIQGKLDKDTLSGTWSHDNVKGDFKVTM